MPDAAPPPSSRGPRLAWLVLPACSLLALLAAWSGDPRPAAAALLLLALGALVLAGRNGGWKPRLALGVLLAGAVWAAWRGWSASVLDLVPLAINAALAGWFGVTLRAGREPRVAGFIRVLEGPGRLAAPGIARYARQVTWYWTLLLAAQALLLALLALCAQRSGWLARAGGTPWLVVPEPLAAFWQHAGSYAVPVAGFLAEYAVRRVRLRHLAQPGLAATARALVTRWPQLLRSGDSAHG